MQPKAIPDPLYLRMLKDQDDPDGEIQPLRVDQFDSNIIGLDEEKLSSVTIGLIDDYRFSQECLIKAFQSINARLAVLPFMSVRECIEQARPDLDLVIYYSHVGKASDAMDAKKISTLHDAFQDRPLIVLSDAEDADHPNIIRNTLRNGAHGLIPTRTTGIEMAVAAIRFIKAGGVFAPLDLLLTNRASPTTEAASQRRLTARQMDVLNHLQQGKANKIIAHELGMSESTVKVHVRNIMRKVGATNRTQAAYKAQRSSEFLDATRILDH